ncbi:MAG: hypothetical protein K0R61_4420 [Microvirga sp.]|jgi:hypothetical protein|nr:hypothetical protein [Microvirga sp.]
MSSAVLENTPELGPPQMSFDHSNLQASMAARSHSAFQVHGSSRTSLWALVLPRGHALEYAGQPAKSSALISSALYRKRTDAVGEFPGPEPLRENLFAEWYQNGRK